jgi:hypothetical protein
MKADEKFFRMNFSVFLKRIWQVFAGMLLVQVIGGFIAPSSDWSFFIAGAAQNDSMSVEKPGSHHHHSGSTPQPGQWEGSPKGIAYSEFNHALAGGGVILVGLSELHRAMGWRLLVWIRWLLPVSLISSGIFLVIWSDHLAWPIGPWTLSETLSGKDPEMLQHKIYGILAIGVGSVEGFILANHCRYWCWRAVLPGFALVGGFMLFLHMHGPHPAAHQIQVHHTVMGTLALAASLAWFAGEWHYWSPHARYLFSQPRSVMKIVWAFLILAIGVQLLFYSET